MEEEGLAPSKKNAARLGAHIVFADESGFLMAPLVVRTWAPRGSTPFLRYRQGRREKISVISGISLSPERHRLGLYYLLFYENIGEEEVCVFLREWCAEPFFRLCCSRNIDRSVLFGESCKDSTIRYETVRVQAVVLRQESRTRGAQ